MARVVILVLPPHTTHRLQPCDVSFFGPLESYFNFELTTWLKNHPGRTVGLYQISGIFSNSYCKAATIGNALSGFKSTGINPFNPDIFPDHLYAPSDVTDKPNPEDVEVASPSGELGIPLADAHGSHQIPEGVEVATPSEEIGVPHADAHDTEANSEEVNVARPSKELRNVEDDVSVHSVKDCLKILSIAQSVYETII